MAGLVASALAISCLVAVLPAGAAEHNVTVNGKPIYTHTAVIVHSGDTITITASGKISFGGGKISGLGPGGIPWGAECDAIANPHQRRLPWPLRGAPCWSLIGRIGKNKAIEIGPSQTFTADHDGELLLGVNDNFTRDNTGTWDAKVTVTPAGVAPPSKKSSKGTAVTIVFIGALLLLAFLLVLFFARRRRTPREPAEMAAVAAAQFPPPPVVPGGEPAAAGVIPAPEPEPEPMPVVPPIPTAPPDPESIDVNIFEVEFTNGLQLGVGYNHFPDGTLLNWKVTQSHKPVAAGSFITQGGGSTNHYETVPLGIKLQGRDSEPDGADVQFDWNINGVPFRYSVRRDPNC